MIWFLHICRCSCLQWWWNCLFCGCCPVLALFVLCFFYPQTSNERHHMAACALPPTSILEFKLRLYSKLFCRWNWRLSSGSPNQRRRQSISFAEKVKGHRDPGPSLNLDRQRYRGDQHFHPPDLIQRASDLRETDEELQRKRRLLC